MSLTKKVGKKWVSTGNQSDSLIEYKYFTTYNVLVVDHGFVCNFVYFVIINSVIFWANAPFLIGGTMSYILY